MISSFTTRCHDFIWFLIFTFTFYCKPYLKMLFTHKFVLLYSGAGDSERSLK